MTISKIEKLQSDHACVGTWLSSGSPAITELAAQCGFDWLLLDMEHGCFSEADLLQNLRAATGHDVAVVVRVPTHEAGCVARVLDWGADAIMVPHVDSPQEAAALVNAMRYPPNGTRGYSRSVRAYGYGMENSDTTTSPFLFAQIESAKGVKNVDAIAAVDGIGALFVGPADLKLSLDATKVAPSYEEAIDRIISAAQINGIHSGILVREPSETESLRQKGFTKIAVDSDIGILRKGFLSTIRSCQYSS